MVEFSEAEPLDESDDSDADKNVNEDDDEDDLFEVKDPLEEEEEEPDSSRNRVLMTVTHDWSAPTVRQCLAHARAAELNFSGDGNHCGLVTLLILMVSLLQMLASIRNKFVTGRWDEASDAATLLQRHEAALRGEFSDDDDNDDNDDNDEVYGDFEDLETGETHEAGDTEAGEGEEPKEAPKLKKDMTVLERRTMKKARMKALFDEEYDKVTGGGKTHFDEVGHCGLESKGCCAVKECCAGSCRPLPCLSTLLMCSCDCR